MKTNFSRRTIVIGFVILLAGMPALAAQARTSAADDGAGFRALASIMGEPAWSTNGGAPDSAPTCGEDGHCNYLVCPEPDCEPNQNAQCECEYSGSDCEEQHGMWPWDRDEHPIYDCTCTCYNDPPPPPHCTVYDPTTGKCLVAET